jgi:threonine dehydrogenase-like Zn-dependent dehydrogenase
VVRTRERRAYRPGGEPEAVLVRVRRCAPCGAEVVAVERELANLNEPVKWAETESLLDV